MLRLAISALLCASAWAQYMPPSTGGGGGGSTPIGGVGAVQLYATSSTQTGDNSVIYGGLSSISASAPSITKTGSGSTSWGYGCVYFNAIGGTAISSETTIANQANTLDGTHVNHVTCPSLAGTTGVVNIYILTAGSGGTTGLIAEGEAAGVAFNDDDGNGDGDPPSSNFTAGLFVADNLKVVGFMAVAGADFDPTITLNLVKDWGSIDSSRQGFSVNVNAQMHNGAFLSAGNFSAQNDDSSTGNNVQVRGVFAQGQYNGTGTDNLVIGGGFGATSNSATGTLGVLTAIYALSENDGAATVDKQSSIYATGVSTSAGTVNNLYGVWVTPPTNVGGGTITTNVSFYADDQTATGITNNYYSWFDSQGVRRVKEDTTYDMVGQAIEALYNPQFTKYTPGAVNFERIILGQWNGNVAEIGTEKGGNGTLRVLRFIGASVELPGSTFTFDGKTCSIVTGAIACT